MQHGFIVGPFFHLCQVEECRSYLSLFGASAPKFYLLEIKTNIFVRKKEVLEALLELFISYFEKKLSVGGTLSPFWRNGVQLEVLLYLAFVKLFLSLSILLGIDSNSFGFNCILIALILSSKSSFKNLNTDVILNGLVQVTGPSGQITWIRGGPKCLDARSITEAIDSRFFIPPLINF